MNLENLSLEYIIVAMAGVILYLLYYVFTKDSEYNRNIHSVASVVEDLNREIYYLKKKLDKHQQSAQENTRSLSDEEIYQEIERSVYDMVHPLSLGLKQAKEAIHAINTQIDARISMLENGVKQISIPSSIHGNDDEKILSLYKQGVSLETISKELHISKPEVEFVLKINKIK
ncbi:MAG: hypothetical protein PHI89_03855 [Thiovulaceae bacterium]|nr:hypothetical protein [Sulfurimonadaceae bacterium]